MAVVGALLKETTKVGYKFSIKRKRLLNNDQQSVLLKLILKSEQTQFGQHHRFKEIATSDNLSEAFRRHVPLTNYDQFYPWIARMRAGEKNVTYPGRVGFFALSSGTTQGSSKQIPVTDKMIRQFQKTTFEQLLYLHELNLPKEFYAAQVLTIGGSTKLVEHIDFFEGDLSGILQKHKSFVFKPFSKPSSAISQLKDWEAKMEAIVEKAPSWDIGVIAGVPSWILMLLNRIVHRYALQSIHDIWPNLKIFLHGGVFLDSYESKIKSLCGKQLLFMNTYLASEGYFAYQKYPRSEGMKLLLNHGVYYEFIEEQYFDRILDASSRFEDIPTFTIDEVEEGKNYGLVISTVSGLWRYVIGDVVRFSNLQEKEIQLTGRISHYLSMVGEHLSLENLADALKNTAQFFGISCEEFCVIPNKQNDRHHWYVSASKLPDHRHFEVVLNHELEQLNDDYRSLRMHLIRSPKVKFLPVQKFYEFMAFKGKIGGQHKFPRVLSAIQAREWESFLNNVEW
jgi:hypothetical protein